MKSEQCFECGAEKKLHHHHVIPKSLGGKKTIPLCEKCHGLVHNRKFDVQTLTVNAMTKLRKSNRLLSSRVPFGYTVSKKDKNILIKNPHQQRIILKIIKMRKSGKTLLNISNTMISTKVKTVYGGKWRPSSIAAIITRYNKLHGK
jgi:hypothetical protein